MNRLSSIVEQIPKSGIRDFFEIVQSMENVISLGIGEPDFVTPWHIREAAIYALERGKTAYTSNLGLPRLRKAIAHYVSEKLGVSYDPRNEILVTVGVSEGIDLALRAVLNPGDEVLYHEPCYVSYAPTILLAGGLPKPIPTRLEDDFILFSSAIEKAITPRTRVLLLNFPTNPTGAILPRSELLKIAELCIAHDLLVITDEIYSELTYDQVEHHSIAALEGMKQRVILLHGVSKAFAMTGWRLGFACGPDDLIGGMMKIHQYAILCAPNMLQEAAIEALESGAPSLLKMRNQYAQRRDFVAKRCQELGLPFSFPRGAFYIFPSIAHLGFSSKEFAMQLLHKKKVALIPGTAFGESGEGFVRCSYATSMEKLHDAFSRIEEFLHERKS